MRIKKIKKRALAEVYDSVKAAASALDLPISVLKKAKGAGCPAFRGGRVHVADFKKWLKENPIDTAGGGDLREQKLAQEVRRLTIANDAKQRELVSRAWVVERFQRAGGELHTLRAKSEAEHPLLFAAACPGADVAACRTILRGIWTDVFKLIDGMGKHFDEGAHVRPSNAGAPLDAEPLVDGSASAKN
ncbi:MAG TPA: hypothetical protein VL357_01740 [Rariglobus sp.]|jgi:hypothetical protein|nr:hypothetical protein [Rariglobus sp.]